MSWFQDHVFKFEPSYVKNDDLNKHFKGGHLEFIEDEIEEVALILVENTDGSPQPPRDKPSPQ